MFSCMMWSDCLSDYEEKKSMKIYIASHCRWAALHVASVFAEKGHRITSRWIYEPFNTTESYTDADKRRIATEDEGDVYAADALVLIAGPDRYPGGKFVELGIALAADKKIVVIGRRENMLVWHPKILTAETPCIAEKLLA